MFMGTVDRTRGLEMKRKWKIGCLLVILYCVGCGILLGTYGGLFSITVEMSTLQGGRRMSRYDAVISRCFDIVTAPAQVAFFGSLMAIDRVCEYMGTRGRERKKLSRGGDRQ